MNAAARNVEQGSLFHGSFTRAKMTRDVIGVTMLVLIMLISAFSVVYVKNYERRLFSELQFSQQSAQKLHVEWGQLLLEQSTWATPSRIQLIAQQRFGMKVPSASRIFMVRM